jgi:hypothetical protein
MTVLSEATEPHSRLLRCSLCVEESRAYWSHVDPGDPRASASSAFASSWFGAKSEAWTTELLANMRVRFDGFPSGLRVLAGWRAMTPETRRVVCHFHVQLTDPLYRSFSGEFLPARRDALRPDVHRQTVIQWTTEHGPPRWAMKTQLQFATRLLSCASAAGLLTGNRDPRQAIAPRVPDHALEYMLYTLRALRFEGNLVKNPYLASLGLVGGHLADRLRSLRTIQFRQVGDVYEFEWRYADLETWAAGELEVTTPQPDGSSRMATAAQVRA